MSTPNAPRSDPFAGFESFDTKNNPTLERAKNTLKKLAALIRTEGPLDEPMIVGLQGKPGLGKSHLIEAFTQAVKEVKGVKLVKPTDTHQFFAMKYNYNEANIIVTDDLFQKAASIDEVFKEKNWEKGWYPAQKLPEFLFDLYDGKKIWVVSSNFDIKDILNRISEMDGQDRLKSRIAHLLATTGTIHLEGDDHRKVLANTGTRFTKLFE